MEYRDEIEMPVISPVQYKTKKCNIIHRFFRWVKYTRQWRIEKDWYFKLKDGTVFLVSKGFIFDGASVPKVLRGMLSPVGILFLAGLIHDYGYRYNKLIEVCSNESGDMEQFDYHPGAGKVFWDGMFKKVADQTNGMVVINSVAYSMLSAFGFMAWNGRRKEEKKLNANP